MEIEMVLMPRTPRNEGFWVLAGVQVPTHGLIEVKLQTLVSDPLFAIVHGAIFLSNKVMETLRVARVKFKALEKVDFDLRSAVNEGLKPFLLGIEKTENEEYIYNSKVCTDNDNPTQEKPNVESGVNRGLEGDAEIQAKLDLLTEGMGSGDF